MNKIWTCTTAFLQCLDLIDEQVGFNNHMFTLTSHKATVDHLFSMHPLQFQPQWQVTKCDNLGMIH